jgi:hypothetical protein
MPRLVKRPILANGRGERSFAFANDTPPCGIKLPRGWGTRCVRIEVLRLIKGEVVGLI